MKALFFQYVAAGASLGACGIGYAGVAATLFLSGAYASGNFNGKTPTSAENNDSGLTKRLG